MDAWSVPPAPGRNGLGTSFPPSGYPRCADGLTLLPCGVKSSNFVNRMSKPSTTILFTRLCRLTAEATSAIHNRHRAAAPADPPPPCPPSPVLLQCGRHLPLDGRTPA